MSKQFTSIHRLDDPTVGARAECEIGAVLDGSHQNSSVTRTELLAF
jgi:hypothetical protein